MPEGIIEILTVQGKPGIFEERHPFTVNLAAQEVSLDAYPVDGRLPVLRTAAHDAIDTNGLGFKWFQKNDNIRLLSAGLFYPYYFIPSTLPIYCQLRWRAETTGNFLSPPVGDLGFFSLPYENYDCPLDIYLPFPATGVAFPDKACLIFSLTVGAPHTFRDNKISMIGVDASFDQETLYLTPFVKILHNLPLVAGQAAP